MAETEYSKTLAHIHHTAFGELARAAAKWIAATFPASTHPRVVDLGCGSGILAESLSGKGHQVTGVDISEAMLDIARSEASDANFMHGSIYAVDLPDCDLVSMTGEVINYQFDEEVGAQALARLFERINHCLRPGGVYIFDFLTPDVEPTESEEQGDGWSITVSSERDDKKMVLRREINITDDTGSETKTSQEVHVVQLYRPDLLFTQLTENGFSVTAIKGYGGPTFRRGHAGFICEKMHHYIPGGQPAWV